jgi:hypothetical protein
MPGELSFRDIPDPGPKAVISRKGLTLSDERNLCTILSQLGCRYVEECCDSVSRSFHPSILPVQFFIPFGPSIRIPFFASI